MISETYRYDGDRDYRARYYDPTLGRFVSEDPIDFEGGINFYSYVENSPLDFVDPLGFIRKCITKLMLVTAYADHGPGKDRSFYKPRKKGTKPRSVGPGTIAVANSSPQPYPFGADVTVLGPNGTVAYQGQVHDTGAGWDSDHHNVAADEWIDIWLPTKKQARRWGKKMLKVTVCYECETK
jgi:RHS repeat-associated protein